MDLKDFLSSRYDSEAFESFVQERFYGVDIYDSSHTDELLNDTEKKSIDSYRIVGKSELDDGKEIGFFEFLSTTPNIENKRVGYNAILKKLAYDEMLDGAIASFYHPDSDAWRLSFVGFEYDDGRASVTNLKRFTYVLGRNVPIQTPLAQLKELKYPSMQEVQTAFSVERVTKEFFDKYRDLYIELSDYLLPQIAYFGKEKNISLFAKKLLGRVVFLYFLQKKGWLGSQDQWGTGNKRFLSECFFEKCKYDNFYSEILRPIFFEALNTKREDDYFPLLDCKMPFLNGGLFNKDEFDQIEDIIIDNGIFESIFATFDQYNFTIIEDNPHDSEIAIDPEMLGRVFESLLDDRKDKGAFYTPREIVHYMSRRAIEYYLKSVSGRYDYVFGVDEFLEKATLPDEEVLEFYKYHPVKFVKIDNYFKALEPYKTLIVDFYIVLKIRGLLLDENSKRSKGKKGHPEITSNIWRKILKKEYETVAINFGSNKEIKLNKKYKYPTILKYIQIDERFYAMAFLPNIWGDLELNTIFPIREKNIRKRLSKFDKPLQEINRDNFVFDHNVYEEVEALREDCRSLHAEPLHQGAELSRQAVVSKGLSTFRNTFTLSSLADSDLKILLADKDYYNKTINKLLNSTSMDQHKLKDIMLKKLKQIKVLDPAIGSGAFPMGVLHEIIELRRHLGDETPLVKLKKEIIENAIYGIDIEPSAVEIAKLRFWLSIVVDEDTPTPLPNLFYKIMVGNSLLETINGFDPLDIKESTLFGDTYKLHLLQDKFHAYYKEWDNARKAALQQEIDEIIDEVLDSKLAQHQDEIDSRLRNADLFKMDKKTTEAIASAHEEMFLIDKVRDKPTTELFFYKLYFGEVLSSGGFDVVIGNPPYVRQEKIKELKPRLKIENYQSYNGTADLYIYFFEKGYNLLKDNGVLSYITSNKYTRAKYGKEFRAFLLESARILEYIDFNGVKVFESATVDTSILSFQKSRVKHDTFVYCDIDDSYNKGDKIENFVAEYGFAYSQDDLSIESFSFANPQELAIKKRIEEVGTPLKEWDIKINYGIKTGLNEAFIIDGKTKDELIAQDPKSTEIIKPLLRGKDIGRYSYMFADKWLIGTFPALNLDIDDYPAIKEWLEQFLPKLEQTGREYIDENGNKQKTRKKTHNKWFETQDQIAYWKEFEREKIVWTSISKINTFTYTEQEIYTNDKCFIMTGVSLKYLSALMNSKVFFYYYQFDGIQLSSGFEFKKFKVEKVPIPNIPTKAQKSFETIVEHIIRAKELGMGDEAKLFEDVIDAMVLELYFEDEMREAGFAFIAHAAKLFEPIERLTDSQAAEVISSAYQTLREPDNPIRNDLQLLPIRVPIVAPILESI